MMRLPAGLPLCRLCGRGAMLPVERAELFHPPGKTVRVLTLAAACEHCGRTTVLPSQMAENLERRRAREVEYGPHLLGEEISTQRRRSGLTLKQAGELVGKNAQVFSRYENETAFPDAHTRSRILCAMRRD